MRREVREPTRVDDGARQPSSRSSHWLRCTTGELAASEPREAAARPRARRRVRHAFHATLPNRAKHYAIDYELAASMKSAATASRPSHAYVASARPCFGRRGPRLRIVSCTRQRRERVRGRVWPLVETSMGMTPSKGWQWATARRHRRRRRVQSQARRHRLRRHRSAAQQEERLGGTAVSATICATRSARGGG